MPVCYCSWYQLAVPSVLIPVTRAYYHNPTTLPANTKQKTKEFGQSLWKHCAKAYVGIYVSYHDFVRNHVQTCETSHSSTCSLADIITASPLSPANVSNTEREGRSAPWSSGGRTPSNGLLYIVHKWNTCVRSSVAMHFDLKHGLSQQGPPLFYNFFVLLHVLGRWDRRGDIQNTSCGICTNIYLKYCEHGVGSAGSWFLNEILVVASVTINIMAHECTGRVIS